MATLEVFAHLTVRPGQLEGFKKQAAECIRITREKDTRTLRYDWFLTSDGTECEVHESYTGPEGLIEHNSHILEARNRLFKDYADNHFMTCTEKHRSRCSICSRHTESGSSGFTSCRGWSRPQRSRRGFPWWPARPGHVHEGAAARQAQRTIGWGDLCSRRTNARDL